MLQEIVERGSCERRDLLLQKFPPAALEFLKIQGLGPKSIALLFEHFRVTTMDELEQLCQEQKLRALPRMGAKLEEKVLRIIAQYRQRSGRFLLSFADNAARELTRISRASLDGIENDHARRAACGAARKPSAISICWSPARTRRRRSIASRRIRACTKCSGRGANKTSVKLGREGLQVDVRALTTRELRRGDAVLHRQQGAQRRPAPARHPHGIQAQRVRPVPRRGRMRAWRAKPKKSLRSARPRLGFRPNCARTAARSKLAEERTRCRSWWS